MSRRGVVVVAGGTGTRMNSSLAKQFMLVAGKPIMAHTLEVFRDFDREAQIVVVLHHSLFDTWKAICQEYQIDVPHQLVEGGAERFHSVKNGLDALDSDVSIVGVHDAVRPLVSRETIERCFSKAAEHGAAIPVTPVTDTIRQLEGSGSKTLLRSQLRAVQTPQCFALDLLKKAYETPFEPGFTDDASVVEHMGHEVILAQGNRTNIKITTPEDLYIAEAFFSGALKA